MTALSNGASYSDDANGHPTRRMQGGRLYFQTFDAENRLVSVLTQGAGLTQSIYNDDGVRVKLIRPAGTGTRLVGPLE